MNDRNMAYRRPYRAELAWLIEIADGLRAPAPIAQRPLVQPPKPPEPTKQPVAVTAGEQENALAHQRTLAQPPKPAGWVSMFRFTPGAFNVADRLLRKEATQRKPQKAKMAQTAGLASAFRIRRRGK